MRPLCSLNFALTHTTNVSVVQAERHKHKSQKCFYLCVLVFQRACDCAWRFAWIASKIRKSGKSVGTGGNGDGEGGLMLSWTSI